MQSHLARFLPGISIRSFAADSPKSAATVAGGQEFLRERDSREYVLVATEAPASRELIAFMRVCPGEMGSSQLVAGGAVDIVRDRPGVAVSRRGRS